MTTPSHPAEPHTGSVASKLNWLRAGVLGANDGIVSTAGIVVGVAAATAERGLFNDPHHLAMDSRGRLFVSDRGNNRIEIFDQDGTFIGLWTHFGRPSSIAIDQQDRIYVVDGTTSLTGVQRVGFSGGGSYGYDRGIRIGSAETGSIETFIPELQLSGFTDSGAPLGVDQEFIGLHPDGSILVGEVEIGERAGRRLVQWIRMK